MASKVIVAGGDAKYFTLLEDLAASVREFRDAAALGLTIIDAGLEPAQAAHLARRYGARVITIGWEFPEAEARAGGKEHLKLALVRAFLDKHNPDADLIAWVDADAWVQDIAAIDTLFEAAALNRLAIISQTSRYSSHTMRLEWVGFGMARVRSILYKNARNAGLPEALARRVANKPTMNGGVYALAREAPHWEVWRARMGQVLRKGRVFTADQLSIGLMIYVDGLPVELCPETCNYMGPWKASADGRTLVEYYLPNRPVGIVHMAGQDAMRENPDLAIAIPTVDGQVIQRTLRRAGWRPGGPSQV